MLEHVEQLRAEQSADQAVDRGVERGLWQAGAAELPAEDPEPGQRAERDHGAEAGDLERPDAEEDGIQEI